MIDFSLPLEPTDWMILGAEKENWLYISNKSVDGIELNRYLVSDFGRIFDLKLNRRAPEYNFGGYKTVSLNTISGSHTFLIHRIVLIEFTGFENDKNIANHINGIKTCCLLNNLEWVTESENTRHAFETGLNTNIGENSVLAKLSDNDVLNIMYQLRDGIPVKEIAKSVPDVITEPLSAVYAIRKGNAWNHLAKKHNIIFAEYKDESDRFSEEEKDTIGRMLSERKPSDFILKSLGYDISSMEYKELKGYRSTISQIKGGRVAPHIAEKYKLLEMEKIPRQTSVSIFTLDQLHSACKVFENGFVSYDDTLIKIGLDPDNMSRKERERYVGGLRALKSKKNYSEITSLYKF